MLNSKSIRRDFPILSLRREDGKPLIYLDNAATTLKPRQVISAIIRYYERYTANVHRGLYRLAQEATSLYENAREAVAKFIKADSSEVVFTKNATEGVNIVAYGLNWEPGDEVVTTVMEHHSNLVPWQIIRDKFRVKLKFLDITDDGDLNVEDLTSLVSKHTKLLALNHVSNVLGTVNPVEKLIKLAHEHEVPVLIDAAQSVPHIPIDVRRLRCDFLVFSGHKMLGPTGIGVLYVNRDASDTLQPAFGGGEMISKVDLEKAEWNDMPWRFEPGTPNVAGAAGLAAAVEYLEKIGMDNVRRHEIQLTDLALKRLSDLESVVVYGPKRAENRCGLVAFNVKGVNSHDVALLLDELENIAVRSGLHCAEPLHRRLKAQSSVRASFYIYNILEEVEILCNTVEKIAGLL
ncbi:cysteine desulfurase [Candidatus Bathyarchaeota archaeon]|nr:cysteine desulfurase [Candidatus Bathyarchaeota archaeon]